MSGEPGRRTRLLAGGCVWAFIGALFLVVVGLLLASFLAQGLGRPAEPKQTTPERSMPELTRSGLERAAGDGRLTDYEVAQAAAFNPHEQETGDADLRITVTYPDHPGDPGGCYRFVVPLPLGPETRVELPRRGEGCDGGAGGN